MRFIEKYNLKKIIILKSSRYLLAASWRQIYTFVLETANIL